MHVENLASVLTKVDSGKLKDQLNERLRAFVEGEIDHASEAFSSLWRTLTDGGGGETSRDIRFLEGRSNPTPLGGPQLPATPLEVALIKSIRQGSFCDRKYSVKRNNTGNLRAPVYASGVVLEGIEPRLSTCELLFMHRHIPSYPNTRSNQRSEEERSRVLRR